MYGSFAQGIGDEYSDIEFWLFVTPGPEQLDTREWCAAISPTTYLTENEFGAHVAFFPGPVRGEFHFAGSADIDSVRSWPARGAAVDDMVVVDRNGVLTQALAALRVDPELPHTADEVEQLCGQFVNWLVVAHQVACRGEHQRAVDALAHTRRHLLWMARLSTGRTARWLTPSRLAEADLPAGIVTELQATAATADPEQIAGAVGASWKAGRRYWSELSSRHDRPVPAALFAELDALL